MLRQTSEHAAQAVDGAQFGRGPLFRPRRLIFGQGRLFRRRRVIAAPHSSRDSSSRRASAPRMRGLMEKAWGGQFYGRHRPPCVTYMHAHVHIPTVSLHTLPATHFSHFRLVTWITGGMSIKERMAALQSASGTASAPEGRQGKVLHAGWLYKAGVFGAKNKRYCVLYDDQQLTWYDDEAKTKYKGGCRLKGASASINGGLLEVSADSKSSFKHDEEAVLIAWCSRLSAAIAGAPQPSGTLDDAPSEPARLHTYTPGPGPEPAPAPVAREGSTQSWIAAGFATGPPRLEPALSPTPSLSPAPVVENVVLHAGAPCLTQLAELAGRLQKLAGDPAATPQIDAEASQQALAAQLEEIAHSVERSALRLELAHFEQLVGRLERLGGGSTSGGGQAPGTPPQTHLTALTYGDFMVTGADPKLYSHVGQLESLVSRLATLAA